MPFTPFYWGPASFLGFFLYDVPYMMILPASVITLLVMATQNPIETQGTYELPET